MTLLMVWREGSLDRLWIVGDSRLSLSGIGGGDIRLTDRGAKVLEVHQHLLGHDPKVAPLKSRTVGFAYTGSTLIALQAYAAVLPLWARLTSSGEQTLPTIHACADHLGIFLQAYAFEVAAAGGPINAECILIGYDDQSAAVEAWRAKVSRSLGGTDLSVTQIVLGDGQMELFGSGAAAAEEKLRELNPTARPWRREPLELMRSQLQDDVPGTVGGGVQIGLGVPDGFQLCSDAQPFRADVSRAGDPLVAMRYRGFDLFDISRVGHTFASLAGVSG
jgi:hypothetical protein